MGVASKYLGCIKSCEIKDGHQEMTAMMMASVWLATTFHKYIWLYFRRPCPSFYSLAVVVNTIYMAVHLRNVLIAYYKVPYLIELIKSLLIIFL